MATNTGWDRDTPSDTSSVALGDDDIRSIKSFMQAWWEEEHFGTDGSAASAGVHKLGSARPYVGTVSQLSNPESGRIFLASDTSQIWGAFSASTWDLLSSDVELDSVNTWTATQWHTAPIAGFSASTSSLLLESDVSGDASARFQMLASGLMDWGGGAGARDTNLYRAAASHLKTDDKFEASSLVVGGGAAVAKILSGTTTLASVTTIVGDGEHVIAVTISGVTAGDVLSTGIKAGAGSNLQVTPVVDDFNANTVKVNIHNPEATDQGLDAQTINVIAMRL